jgi:hypothetical protein
VFKKSVFKIISLDVLKFELLLDSKKSYVKFEPASFAKK